MTEQEPSTTLSQYGLSPRLAEILRAPMEEGTTRAVDNVRRAAGIRLVQQEFASALADEPFLGHIRQTVAPRELEVVEEVISFYQTQGVEETIIFTSGVADKAVWKGESAYSPDENQRGSYIKRLLNDESRKSIAAARVRLEQLGLELAKEAIERYAERKVELGGEYTLGHKLTDCGRVLHRLANYHQMRKLTDQEIGQIIQS